VHNLATGDKTWLKRAKEITTNGNYMITHRFQNPHRGHNARWTAVFVCLLIFNCCHHSTFAQSRVAADESAWHPSGLFAYKEVHNEVSTIHAFRCVGGNLERIFSSDMGTTIKPPICLSNAVVVATTKGVINKLNLKGELLFQSPPEGFTGVAGFSGRIGDAHIFLTEITQDLKRDKWEFHLYIVNVSGAKPVVVSRQPIIHPKKITRVSDEIAILGSEC
jgi:hypothetical protein